MCFLMSRASPQMRRFAKRLIVCEANENKSAQTQPSNAFHFCEKLRPQLATLMGSVGFRAFLSRSLALASTEVYWLRTLQVNPDGTLEGLDELLAQLDPGKIFEGRVVLLAQLLGSSVAFIGEDLTLRLVHEAWPKAPLNDLNFAINP